MLELAALVLDVMTTMVAVDRQVKQHTEHAEPYDPPALGILSTMSLLASNKASEP